MRDRYQLRGAVRHLPLGEVTEFPANVRESLPAGCLLGVLGIVPTLVGPGAAHATMQVEAQHLNQSGVAQGGAIIALADAVAGWATYGLLDEGNLFTTLELKANLLRAARDGQQLLAVATPVHAGRTTIVLDVSVAHTDDCRTPGKAVARFSCTQLVMQERK
jgi:1,4-dihydroxy-2-naphthoyl-CoA hydrolase